MSRCPDAVICWTFPSICQYFHRLSHWSGLQLFDVNVNRSPSGGVGLVIPPTVVIEQQNESIMQAWGINFLNLANIKVEEVAGTIDKQKPSIIIASVERLQEEGVLTALLPVNISYVSVDEAQVHWFPLLCALYNVHSAQCAFSPR